MPEYIEREALIRLAESISRNIDPNFPTEAVTVLAKFLPASDVVAVVRCKECKHYKPPKQSAHWQNTVNYCCRVVTVKVHADDFCSYGERRGEDG